MNVTSLKKHIGEFRQSMAGGSLFHLFGFAESRLGDVVDDHIESKITAFSGKIETLRVVEVSC